MTGQRGPAIQGKIFEYFMTRPNWAVHLPELATSIGETDLERVRRGVLNMKRSKEEVGRLATIQRGQVWKWTPRQGSGLPGSNDPTAEPPLVPRDSGDTVENWNAEPPNPLLEGLLEEGQRQDHLLLNGTGEGQPMPSREPCDDPACDCHIPPYEDKSQNIPNPFAAQNAEAAQVWAEKDVADPDRHIDPMKAARNFTRNVMSPPTEQELQGKMDALLRAAVRRGVLTQQEADQLPRTLADMVELEKDRLQQMAYGVRDPYLAKKFPNQHSIPLEMFTQEKPRGAFDTPETMFQQVGLTQDGDALLKDENGNFWRAKRI